jgi:putative hydrolase of the HAD superfamily
MIHPEHITTIFVDIGGVLLTNGWDRKARQRASTTFNLDNEEMNERHHLTFVTYEEGKLSLDNYLDRVIFHVKRPFSKREFKDFMFAQSQPYPQMIDLIQEIKTRYGIKVAAVSNEGRELTEYRIRKYDLDKVCDFFVSSSFVHFRKPDEEIYQVALDMAQVQPRQVIYIEDRALFVEVAQNLGLHCIRHENFDTTRETLETYGFIIEKSKLETQ